MLALSSFAGCASKPGEQTPTQAAAASKDSAPAAPCAPVTLVALKEQSLLFHSALPDSATRLRITIRPLTGDVTGWTITREAFEPAQDSAHKEKITSWREQTLVAQADGSLALSREVNKDDAVSVDFNPPMIVYPSTLPPTAADTPGFTQTFHVTVHPIDNDKKIKVQGQGTQEITYLSDTPATLDGSPVTAIKLRSVFVSDFGGPKTRNESNQWLVAKHGLARESRNETTKLLGVQIRDNAEAWMLPSFKLDDRPAH